MTLAGKRPEEVPLDALFTFEGDPEDAEPWRMVEVSDGKACSRMGMRRDQVRGFLKSSRIIPLKDKG